MTGITNELICEMLKSLHTGQADIKLTLSDHTRQLSRVRAELNSLHGQIAALRDGDPHREIIQAQIDNRRKRPVTAALCQG